MMIREHEDEDDSVPAKFENCWFSCLLELVEGKGYAV